MAYYYFTPEICLTCAHSVEPYIVFLADFLFNFTTSALPQFHRSAVPQPAPPAGSSDSLDSKMQHIVEVSTRSFNDIVMNPYKV
jgi:hypothetical protein